MPPSEESAGCDESAERVLNGDGGFSLLSSVPLPPSVSPFTSFPSLKTRGGVGILIVIIVLSMGNRGLRGVGLWLSVKPPGENEAKEGRPLPHSTNRLKV